MSEEVTTKNFSTLLPIVYKSAEAYYAKLTKNSNRYIETMDIVGGHPSKDEVDLLLDMQNPGLKLVSLSRETIDDARSTYIKNYHSYFTRRDERLFNNFIADCAVYMHFNPESGDDSYINKYYEKFLSKNSSLGKEDIIDAIISKSLFDNNSFDIFAKSDSFAMQKFAARYLPVDKLIDLTNSKYPQVRLIAYTRLGGEYVEDMLLDNDRKIRNLGIGMLPMGYHVSDKIL
jgi:hypothetical protein